MYISVLGVILKNAYKTVIWIFTSWNFFLVILETILNSKMQKYLLFQIINALDYQVSEEARRNPNSYPVAKTLFSMAFSK